MIKISFFEQIQSKNVFFSNLYMTYLMVMKKIHTVSCGKSALKCG